MTAGIQDASAPERFRWVGWLASRQAFWVFLAVCLACLFLSFATSSFATSNNLFNVTRNFTFVAIIALGMTIVIITGGIDLSVGSVLCLCSMVLAVVMHAGYSIEIGIAASLGTALLIGAINGVLIAYLGMPPFVVTLGMLSIARSLAMVASNNTVVFQFGPDHDKLLALGGGAFFSELQTPLSIWCSWHFLRASCCAGHALAGMSLRSVEMSMPPFSQVCRSAEPRFWSMSYHRWLRVLPASSRPDGSAQSPRNLGSGMELQVIAAAVIGGANLAGGSGTAAGAIVGSALIEVIRNSLGLLGINAFWQGAFRRNIYRDCSGIRPDPKYAAGRLRP